MQTKRKEVERVRKTKRKDVKINNIPARTAEARENQIINEAMNEAERQIMEGTASSQVITYFLKLGSSKERLEKEKLQNENKLLQAKVEALKSAARVEELYKDAMKAFTSYKGTPDSEEEENG